MNEAQKQKVISDVEETFQHIEKRINFSTGTVKNSPKVCEVRAWKSFSVLVVSVKFDGMPYKITPSQALESLGSGFLFDGELIYSMGSHFSKSKPGRLYKKDGKIWRFIYSQNPYLLELIKNMREYDYHITLAINGGSLEGVDILNMDKNDMPDIVYKGSMERLGKTWYQYQILHKSSDKTYPKSYFGDLCKISSDMCYDFEEKMEHKAVLDIQGDQIFINICSELTKPSYFSKMRETTRWFLGYDN